MVLAGLAVAFVATVGTASADQRIASKQAQAQAVLGEIQKLNSESERAQNALYSATQQLGRIESDLKTNTRHLVLARHSLGIAQSRAAARLRALYMNGDNAGTVEVLLGSSSINDLINRVDTARRVSRQDAQVLGDVRTFRTEVATRQARLKKARTAQAQLVKERASAKHEIDSRLSEQSRLLDSIKSQLVQLRAEERRRQERLAAEARERYLQQLRMQRAQALQAQDAQAVEAATLSQPDGSTGLDPSIPAPPPSYGNVVGIALQYLGTPYVWGASGPGAFDCSGFTSYVYAQVGVSLPHNAAAQYGYGVPVSRDELQPGDLVFFDGLGHVGLYIGNGQFVHAPHTGDVVKISSLDEGWYTASYVGARRIV